MSGYFHHFPRRLHSGKVITDITRRADFRKSIFADPYVYLPFQIEGDMRAEDVAYFYYDDMKYTWLVWMSARIRDPYYEWPMSYENFIRYLQKKYAEDSGLTGYPVIAWTQDETSNTNIVHYRSLEDSDLLISKDSYTLGTTLSTLNASEWEAVRIYTYEEEANNDRAVINLLDKRFANQADRELSKLLNA